MKKSSGSLLRYECCRFEVEGYRTNKAVRGEGEVGCESRVASQSKMRRNWTVYGMLKAMM